jgi:N-acetylneuraminate synthase/sialic acid synthase
MNLRVIETFSERFTDVVIGLSDHQNGISMSLVAYTLGARVFEKHFTLNHTWRGTDHSFSLEPSGLKKMVRDLHNAQKAIGDGVKKPTSSETAPLYKMGKKLVAAHNLEEGHILTEDDIAIKSPNDGLPPYELDHVLGKALMRSIQADENISFQDLSELD